MQLRTLFYCLGLVVLASSCSRSRIEEHNDWARYYEAYGIKNAGFILRDNNHESVHYYNLSRDTTRFTPASTFKIFNALAALETGVAPDDNFLIKWDSVVRWNPDWNKDLTLREAFRVSAVPYFRELARRIGRDDMQQYLDTANYGNRTIGAHLDSFWLDNVLQISADEQLGFIKRLYFNELPFSERSQRIVRSMMLFEDSTNYRLYYKTGWGEQGDHDVLWLVGFAERIEKIKEHENSMNKSDVRIYPYFFAQNFDIPKGDTTHNWKQARIDITKKILRDYGAIR